MDSNCRNLNIDAKTGIDAFYFQYLLDATDVFNF